MSGRSSTIPFFAKCWILKDNLQSSAFLFVFLFLISWSMKLILRQKTCFETMDYRPLSSIERDFADYFSLITDLTCRRAKDQLNIWTRGLILYQNFRGQQREQFYPDYFPNTVFWLFSTVQSSNLKKQHMVELFFNRQAVTFILISVDLNFNVGYLSESLPDIWHSVSTSYFLSV